MFLKLHFAISFSVYIYIYIYIYIYTNLQLSPLVVTVYPTLQLPRNVFYIIDVL